MATVTSTLAPQLGSAQHMTSDDLMIQRVRQGQQWPFPAGHGMPRQPIQPMVMMPKVNHVTNHYPLFVPQHGNNTMLQFRPHGTTPYGKQDPVQEAVVKLAEMGVRSSRVKTKKPAKVKQDIFRVSSK